MALGLVVAALKGLGRVAPAGERTLFFARFLQAFWQANAHALKGGPARIPSVCGDEPLSLTSSTL
jgi:hypothetical protein